MTPSIRKITLHPDKIKNEIKRLERENRIQQEKRRKGTQAQRKKARTRFCKNQGSHDSTGQEQTIKK